MKLDVITMDKEQAQQAYLDYRAAVRGNGSPEDAMMAAGYRQLAMGHSLLKLADAIVKGGVGNDGFPRMAIARADGQRVRCTLDRTSLETSGPRGVVRFYTQGTLRSSREPSRKLSYDTVTFTDFPRDTRWPAQTLDQRAQWQVGTARAVAIVPSIPATLRPVGTLERFHVLFEVEKWEIERPRAPRDPALLRHIGGDLYAVLAVWDLTELERAVIAGTRVA
jgi:hypothetical protein